MLNDGLIVTLKICAMMVGRHIKKANNSFLQHVMVLVNVAHEGEYLVLVYVHQG